MVAQKIKPFLRWAGSKRQLLHELTLHWPGDSTRYVEPFAGSACFWFHLEPAQAILGDLNADLILTYRCVRRDPDRVIECLRRLSTGKRAYYRIRASSPLLLTESERAARFIYLNKFCFNGLYRTNSKGEFNVPFGNTKGNNTIDEGAIRAAGRLLQRVQLVAGDFEATLSYVQPGDFVYLDPPYMVSHRRSFVEYQPTAFAEPDLYRLRSTLNRLDAQGASFLVSYADSPEASFLKSDWTWRSVQTRRNIAGFTSSRGYAQEILATNVN